MVALEKGGVFLIARQPRAARAIIHAAWVELAEGGASRVHRHKELSAAVGDIRRLGPLIVGVKQNQHLAKVRDTEVERVLPRREPVSVAVLERRAAAAVETPETTQFPLERAQDLKVYEHPPVTLRHYAGPIDVEPGMFLGSGQTVLPETFKWFAHKRLENGRVVNVAPGFGRRRDSLPPPAHLDGSYYYFEYKNSGHYGHLLTEGLAKLWGWDEVRRRDPDVRLLMRQHPRDAGRVNARPDHAILSALGIDSDQITWARGPARVQSLYSATPMIHNKDPYSIHPDLRGIWDRARDGLLATEPTIATGRRIFVTRRSGNRLCRNHAQVEELFTAEGFDIVLPAELTVAQQAATFARAEVVAGFGGTGMFNLIFAGNRPDVVILNHTSYDARNEQLVASLIGARTHWFWSDAERAQPGSRFSYKSFQSPWEFDWSQAGELRDLLRTL